MKLKKTLSSAILNAADVRKLEKGCCRIRRSCDKSLAYKALRSTTGHSIVIQHVGKGVGYDAVYRFCKLVFKDDDTFRELMEVCHVDDRTLFTDVLADAAKAEVLADAAKAEEETEAETNEDDEEDEEEEEEKEDEEKEGNHGDDDFASAGSAVAARALSPRFCPDGQLLPKMLALMADHSRIVKSRTDYSLTESLCPHSAGANSDVKFGKHLPSGTAVAVKMPISEDGKRSVAQMNVGLLEEVAILRELKGHPNIVELLDVVFLGKENPLGLVMPRGRPLRQMLSLGDGDKIVFPKMHDSELWHIASQSLAGLAHVHERSILHADFKPGNLLLFAPSDFHFRSQMQGTDTTEQIDAWSKQSDYLQLLERHCNIKLADFGLSKWISPSHHSSKRKKGEYLATAWYRAPEIMFGTDTPLPSSDIFSFGATIWELGLGQPVFAENCPKSKSKYALTKWQVLANILRVKGQAPPALRNLEWFPAKLNGNSPGLPFPSHFSDRVKDLLQSCTNLTANERPSAAAVVGYVFSLRYLRPLPAFVGDRGVSFFQSGDVGEDVLRFLRSDPDWNLVKQQMLRERLSKKTSMPASERKNKDEVVFALTPEGQRTKTFNGQAVRGLIPLTHMRAFRNALAVIMEGSLDQVWQGFQHDVGQCGIEELGTAGCHLIANRPTLVVNAFASVMAMRLGQRGDGPHHDGAASNVHMGLTLFGERELEMQMCSSPKLPPDNCDFQSRRFLQKPGSFYVGNMANVSHEVFHQDAPGSALAANDLFDLGDGSEGCKLAVMFRTCAFPGIGRATKAPPGPKAVWKALCDRLMLYSSNAIRLPTLSEVLQQHRLL